MNKRISCLALALALACMACAFAESSVSLGAVTTATVSDMKSSTGVPLAADFAVAPVPPTEATQAVLDDILAAAGSGSLADFFGVAGMDAGSLKLDEAFPISVTSYDAAYGDVIVTLRLTKDYANDDAIVALVGVVDGGATDWIPVDAATVSGEVAVTFTQQILDAGAASELVFALLSE